MGTTQSTRKITLVNDEKAGVIKLSESLAHRLRGQLEDQQAKPTHSPPEAQPTPAPPEPSYEAVLPPPSPPFISSEPLVPTLPTPPPAEPVIEVDVIPTLEPQEPEPLLLAPEPAIVPEPVPTPEPVLASETEPSLPIPELELELVIQTPSAPVAEVKEPSDVPITTDHIIAPKPSATILPPWAAYVEEAHLMVIKLKEERQEQIKRFDEEYRAKLEAREQKYVDLARISQEQFESSFKEVESLFRKASCTPVCQDVQENVMKCYEDHPQQSLRCSGEVSKFSRCVDLSRLQAVMKEKAS